MTCTFTNTRIQHKVTLVKEWVNGFKDDTAVLTIDGGLKADATSTSTATGAAGSQIDDTNAVETGVYVGDLVSISEILTGFGSYNSSWVCTGKEDLPIDGGTGSGTSGEFTMPDEPVVCTITNTRTQNRIILQKGWVDGLKGDTAELAINGGLTDPAENTSTAAGDKGLQLDEANAAATDVFSGDEVVISEILGGKGAYTSNWECVVLQVEEPSEVVAFDVAFSAGGGGLTGSFTMPDQPVVCTFTNTRKSHEVKLQKAWVNARGGDTAALTIKGGLPETGTPTTTSTATGALGTFLDTTNVASSTVQVGDTVTVTEVLGASNVGKYGATLVCDNGVVPAADGSFSMPDAAVTCTFTNDRSVTAPVPPAPTAETCDPNVPGSQLLGSITVPASPDYRYFIDGKAFAAGTYPFAAGSYTATAQLIVTAPLAAAGFGGLQQLAAQDVYTWTVVVAGSPVCAVLDKESDPVTGPVFTDQVVSYKITVKNGGDTPVVGETLVDKLPEGVEVIESSISPSGVYNPTARTITWKFDLPAAVGSVPSSATFTYQVTVTAEEGSITNTVTWVERSLTDSTTLPVEPGEVGGEETTDEEDGTTVGGSEDLAETGAGNASNVAAAGLLAMVLGGLMVGFGRRRRREG